MTNSPDQKTFTFINSKPSAFDGLGEITWRAPLKCQHCGDLDLKDVVCYDNWYDGCRRENPQCRKCGEPIPGLPDDQNERAIFLARHPERE